MNKHKDKEFFPFYIPLVMAALTVLYSVISHTLTKPDPGQISKIIVMGHGSTGVNYVTLRPEYSWHYFKKGVVYGDTFTTPFRELLNNLFELSYDTFLYFDPSNPTPFFLTLVFLLVSLFLHIRKKK